MRQSYFSIDPTKTVTQICSKGHSWQVFRKLPKKVVDMKCPTCKEMKEEALKLKNALRKQQKEKKDALKREGTGLWD